MKAVIMAGGDGNRLRPLTCDIPKPMARLCGRPILEYILELLALHDISQAVLTVRYLPSAITEHFQDKNFAGIPLDFVEEDLPLGTAGGVKNATDGNEDEILIMSGDAMCDFNLTDFINEHQRSGADASILAIKVEDPREYGLVDVDEEMNIAGFIEKPAYSQAISDLANTGIYILSKKAIDLIPKGEKFDFAKDLFPIMLKKGMKLHCYEGKGYWCDIGDLDSYIRCQRDMLEGKIKCSINGTLQQNGNIFAGKIPQPAVTIIPPVFIGKNVLMEDSAVIESGSVIDDGCYIGRGVRISGSILLKDCYISDRVKLTGSLVCSAATIKSDAMMFEGSTVGANAVVGEKSTVNAGIKIWNQKQVPDGFVANTHIKTATAGKSFFDDEGIIGQIGVELTPEFMARLGSALGSFSPGVRVAVGCSSDHGADVMKAALSAGIQSTGIHIIDFGENFQTQFAFSMNFCSIPIGIYIKGGDKAFVKLLSAGGLPSTREMERSVEGILSRGEFNRTSYERIGDRVEMEGVSEMYKAHLAGYAREGLAETKVSVKSKNQNLLALISDTLKTLECGLGGETTLEFSSQGDKVRLYHPNHGFIMHNKIFTLCCIAELEKGEDIAIPFDSPQVIDKLAKEMGRQALRYFICPADDSDNEERKLAKSQMWSQDALIQSVMFLRIMQNAGGLDNLVAQLPSFDIAERVLGTKGNPAAFIRGISTEKSGGNVTEGVLMHREKGVVLVKPLKRGNGIKIFAEAVSSEMASELCDDIEFLLNKQLGEDEKAL